MVAQIYVISFQPSVEQSIYKAPQPQASKHGFTCPLGVVRQVWHSDCLHTTAKAAMKLLQSELVCL